MKDISRRSLLHQALIAGGAVWSAAPAPAWGRISVPGLDEPSPLYDCWIHLGDEYGTMEEFQVQMSRFGIDGGVVVQLGRSVANQPLIDWVQQYPGRFVAVCRVEVSREDAAEVLQRWVTASRGTIVGIRVNADAISPGRDPLALWKRIRELDLWAMVDHIQEGLEGSRFQRVLDELPGLKISVNHLGRPDTREGHPFPKYSKILRIADRPEAVITMSSLSAWAAPREDPYPYQTVQPFIRMAWQAFGAERMTWGNGYPSDGYARTIPLVLEELSFLRPLDKAWILGETAKKLWPSLTR